MKRLKAMLLMAASAFALQACDQEPEKLPGGDEPVIVDEECPREDGEPCR